MEIIRKIESLESDILQIDFGASNSVSGYSEIVGYCKKLLEDLYDITNRDGFANLEAEVIFFKKIKPKILSNIIYYTRLYHFELKYHRLGKRSGKKYLRKQSKIIERFYHRHSEFVYYIALKSTHFDEHFFTQKHLHKLSPICNRQLTEPDPISSYYDIILSKIMAFQKFEEYLRNHHKNRLTKNSLSKNKLKWTSSKVALTELVYALHSSNAVNFGGADIKEIASSFQDMFSYNLGDFYRTYTEIKSRKKSRTKFIDELAIKMINRLDKENA